MKIGYARTSTVEQEAGFDASACRLSPISGISGHRKCIRVFDRCRRTGR